MTNSEMVDQIIYSFINYNLRDIKEINNNKLNIDFTIAEFILCSCFIDQVSGFRYNISKVGKRYRQFVEDYLPIYNPSNLYRDLRSKLVHNYSTGGFYALTRREPRKHLLEQDGVTHINLEDFIRDLDTALQKYIAELNTDLIIRNNAICWFMKYPILAEK